MGYYKYTGDYFVPLSTEIDTMLNTMVITIYRLMRYMPTSLIF